MTETLIKDYYRDNVPKEWKRLVKDPYHQLEFETTLHFMEKYLTANGLVLDEGRGPGRYTIELAKRGYAVVLLDFTSANLDFARRLTKRAGCRLRVKDLTEGSVVCGKK